MKRLQITEKQSLRKKWDIPSISRKVKIGKLRALKLMLLFKIFPNDNSRILHCNTILLDVAANVETEGISEVGFPSLRNSP